MQQNKKIAVIGGTGKAGKYLINQLSDKQFIRKAPFIAS
jgi:putative NADH-flavin reductase